MSDPGDRTRVVLQWVEKADNDLKTAEHTLSLADDECPYDTVCFHAQQCAEKYIKGLLAHLAIDFPKSHDIGELVELLPSEMHPQISVREQEQLTDHAVATRYPGDWEPLTRCDAKAAVALAHQVRKSIRSHLPI
jgi:HEPN domain-containing protein